ncbi:MAG: DUF1822 family protein [Hormoscilla sp.]
MNITESTVLELPKIDPAEIKPGEIWSIARRTYSPLEFDRDSEQKLYPEAARRELNGEAAPRYVMIVTEPELDPAVSWRIVSVMLLSEKTDYISDVDILIPSQISGVGQDLLAETWQVLPMLDCNLSRPLGPRLSRPIYDVLLDVGDYYHGLRDRAPGIAEIESLGLQGSAVSAREDPEIQAFHQAETDWAAILTVPVAAYRAYQKTLAVTDTLLEMALQLEREFQENSSARDAIASCAVHLSQWFEGIVETGWQKLEEIVGISSANPAFNFRGGSDRSATPRDNSEQIADLINLLSTTSDEDSLWTAVDDLRKIDPENPALGIRNAEPINLGDPPNGKTVALSVALMQRPDQEIAMVLRVYPMGEKYVPPGLELSLLDEEGETVLAATAKRTDAYIQIQLSGEAGEQFSAKIVLGENSITRSFLI